MRELVKKIKSYLAAIRLDERGQATTEYLIVAGALLVVIVALATLAGRLQDGLFVEHAINSASHAFGHNTMGSLGDVLLY